MAGRERGGNTATDIGRGNFQEEKKIFSGDIQYIKLEYAEELKGCLWLEFLRIPYTFAVLCSFVQALETVGSYFTW